MFDKYKRKQIAQKYSLLIPLHTRLEIPLHTSLKQYTRTDDHKAFLVNVASIRTRAMVK